MNSNKGSFTIKYKTNRGKSSHGNKRSSGKRNSSRSFKSRRGRGGASKYIDPKRFINKINHDEVQEVRDYVPSNVYQDFQFENRVKEAIRNKGFVNPTEIQDKAIPFALEGRDIVGLSGTGTGKTAAFLLPILDRLFSGKTNQALILTPTRELAIQIHQELQELHKNKMRIFATVVVGGVPAWRQIKHLKKGKQHIIIGTPGRVIDFIDRGVLDVSRMDTVVLDEADRMLDMGFIDDMRHIMEHVPDKRQTLFFSATMSDPISKLVEEFLTNPEKITIKQQNPSQFVDQDVLRVEGGDRAQTLIDWLQKTDYRKVIVFTETKRESEQVVAKLKQVGLEADYLHGDRDHFERQRTLRKFIEDKIQILVATDVAGRGIDIKNISHVVNYEPPQDFETYIHRIGRTGRAGEIGRAVTLIK